MKPTLTPHVTIEFTISGRSAVSRRALSAGLSVWIDTAVNCANKVASLPEHIAVAGKTKIEGWRIAEVEDA